MSSHAWSKLFDSFLHHLYIHSGLEAFILPLTIKGCRRFVKIRMYLYTKGCLDTYKFRQTCDILFCTYVVLFL
jgi:hypothetical protein